MQIDPLRTLGFTGHRPARLGGYDERLPVWVNLRKVLYRETLEAVKQGFYTFISGMALGYDTIAAEVVLELREQLPDLGIELVAAVPFEGQERKWPAASQARYRGLLAKADYVHTVCTPGFAPWKMHRRNEWIVDNCSLLLALWDGIEDGGTFRCVEYAKRVGREVVTIHPDELKEVASV